jgi:hypothetical protein
VFFRPEEIHCASGITEIFVPLPKRDGYIPHGLFRFGNEEFPIFDLHMNGFSTIQTGAINPNRLARKEPADCQRLERSLSEPLLLPLDRYPVMGGEVIKGRERCYKICFRVKPARNHLGKKGVKGFASLFRRNP